MFSYYFPIPPGTTRQMAFAPERSFSQPAAVVGVDPSIANAVLAFNLAALANAGVDFLAFDASGPLSAESPLVTTAKITAFATPAQSLDGFATASIDQMQSNPVVVAGVAVGDARVVDDA